MIESIVMKYEQKLMQKSNQPDYDILYRNFDEEKQELLGETYN